MQELEIWDDTPEELYPDRWTLDDCFMPDRFCGGTELGMARLHLAGSPVDMPRAKTVDLVPYGAKVLAKRTRGLLSLSREYFEGVKNPLHADTSRNWFGMSTADRKYLLAFEKRTGYFSNEVNP